MHFTQFLFLILIDYTLIILHNIVDETFITLNNIDFVNLPSQNITLANGHGIKNYLACENVNRIDQARRLPTTM